VVNVWDNTLTAREYISYIAEQAGSFACIGRDGKLYFKKIGESISALNKKFFKSMKYGEKFKISRIAYEDGIQDFKQGSVENSTVWINQENMYITSQNQIDDIYDYYNEFEIYSFEGTSIIDPAVDVGDIIKIDDKKIIYQGELSFAGKFIADIKSTIKSKSKQETSTKKKSEKFKIKRLESKIDQVEGNVTILSNEVTENEEKLSEIKLDLDKINLKVEDIADLTNTVSGITKIKLEKCMEGDLISLHIYGNNTVFDRLYPSENLYPSNMLYSKGNSLIKVYDELEENVRIIDLKVDTVLRQYAGIFDEYILEDNKAKIIRRVDVDSFGNKYIREKEFIEDLGELNIALKKGTNYIEICDYEVNLKAKYVTINEFTDKFATTVELQSSITQLADSINLQVSEKLNDKVGIDEVIAKINIAVKENQGTINIEGNQISIKSDNFELSNNGEITATAGKIAGWIISNIGLYKNKAGMLSGNGEEDLAFYAGANSLEDLANANFRVLNDGQVTLKILHIGSGATGINMYDENKDVVSNYNENGLRFYKNGNEMLKLFVYDNQVRWYYKDYFVIQNSENEDIFMSFTPSKLWIYENVDIMGELSINGSFWAPKKTNCIRNSGMNEEWALDHIYVGVSPSDSIGGVIFTTKNGKSVTLYPSSSDKRLKDNIRNTEIKSALDLINQIRHVSFNWKNEHDVRKIGYIAQELEEIEPQFVYKVKQGENAEYDYLYQVDTMTILATATKAIQELSQENKEIKKENEQLKNQIENLETRISKLEKLLNKEEK